MTTHPPDPVPFRGRPVDSGWLVSMVSEWDEPLVLLDLEGRVRFANGALTYLLGSEATRARFIDLVYSDDRISMERSLGLWLTGRCPSGSAVEARLRNASPIYHWRPTLLRDEDGQVQGVGLAGRDVTHERRYEEALEESELRHRALLTGVLDPLVVMDAYGIVQSVSDSVVPILGYRPGELVGRNISILMPEPHRSSHDSYLANYRRTGITNILGHTREFEVLRKDGQPITIELSVSRVDVPGREEPLFTGSLRDVTQRKRAEERLVRSESLLRAIFDQEYQLVALLDLEGKTVDINDRSLELCGLRREQVVGQPFVDILQASMVGEGRDRASEALASARAGEFCRLQADVQCKGEALVLDLSFKPIVEDGKAAFILFEGRDITEMEQSKRREHGMLRALAQVGESAALLAHEIKTPVSAVHHALRAVADRLGKNDREVLEDLEGRMRRLETTLRSTLSFAGPIELRKGPCVLPDLLHEVVGDLREAIEEAGVVVQVMEAEELVFQADRPRLREVLLNLVGNGVSILPKGGRIELHHGRRGGEVFIQVVDDGPGIPAEVRTRLFEPFATAREGGTGLGLAISRRLVEAHDGDLSVIESPLGGAAFQVVLPQRT